MKMNYLCIFAISSFVGHLSYGQKYLTMMEDERYNVYDVIEEAESYFKKNGPVKGYKQYIHWREANEDKFYPTGDRTLSQQTRKAVIENRQLIKLQQQSQVSTTLSNWTELGPTNALYGHPNNSQFYDEPNGNGRVEDVWVNPNDSNEILLASRNGGLWITTNGGVNWTPKTDFLDASGVKAFDVSKQDFNKIYIAVASDYSEGVFKSVDKGNTWSGTSISYNQNQSKIIYKILVHPTNDQIVYAATKSGLIKTTDGFQTFSTVLSGDINDVEFKPGDPSVIYCSNKTDSKFYKSTNNGTSFSIAGNGVATTTTPYIAITAANPSVVYFAGTEVYKSTDSGDNFVLKSTMSTYCYGAFEAASDNENELIYGELDVYHSTDGGTTFTQKTEWVFGSSTGVGGNFIHADIRIARFLNGAFYLGTDGWLVKESSDVDHWQILSFGVNILEIYKHGISVAQSESSLDTVIVGCQDNGTLVRRGGTWYLIRTGDGGRSVIDRTNSNNIIYSLYGGSFKRSVTTGFNDSGTTIYSPKPFALPPLLQDKTNAATYYLGITDEIIKSTDNGLNWSTLYNFGVGSGSVALLEISTVNPQVMVVYKKSTTNTVWKTTDGGVNWVNITSNLPNVSISDITLHPTDTNKIAVSLDSHSSSNKVYITTDGGTTWTNHSTGLPAMPINTIIYAPSQASYDQLYVGTDIGVYYRDTQETQWVKYSNNFPNVIVNSLEIHNNTDTLVAATWGRGVWSVPVINRVTLSNDMIYKNKEVEIIMVLSNQHINLKLKESTKGWLSIFNSIGQLIDYKYFEGNEVNHDVSKLSSGVYYVQLQTENNIKKFKFIK